MPVAGLLLLFFFMCSPDMNMPVISKLASHFLQEKEVALQSRPFGCTDFICSNKKNNTWWL